MKAVGFYSYLSTYISHLPSFIVRPDYSNNNKIVGYNTRVWTERRTDMDTDLNYFILDIRLFLSVSQSLPPFLAVLLTTAKTDQYPTVSQFDNRLTASITQNSAPGLKIKTGWSLGLQRLSKKSKAVPLHAMEAHGGRGGTAPTHT
jgi:hypothetical protein